MALLEKDFENILGKGENAGNQHFLLFKECFLLPQMIIKFFEVHLICHLQVLLIWTSVHFVVMYRANLSSTELSK